MAEIVPNTISDSVAEPDVSTPTEELAISNLAPMVVNGEVHDKEEQRENKEPVKESDGKQTLTDGQATDDSKKPVSGTTNQQPLTNGEVGNPPSCDSNIAPTQTVVTGENHQPITETPTDPPAAAQNAQPISSYPDLTPPSISTSTKGPDVPPLALDQSNASVLVKAELMKNKVEEEFELQGSAEDQQLIFERLAKIKENKKQVLDLLDQMKKKEGEADMDKAMVAKLIGAYDSFKAEEDEYLVILQKIMTLRKEATEVEGSGPPTRENSDLSTAIDILQTAESQSGSSSGTKAEIKAQAPNRPMIEDSLRAEQVGSCTEPGPEEQDEGWAELEALKKQRNLLKKMVSQQQQLRALQGLQGSAVAKQQEEVQNDLRNERDTATNRIAEEAKSIEEKRKELAELKNRLASIKGVTPEDLQPLALTDGPVSNSGPSGGYEETGLCPIIPGNGAEMEAVQPAEVVEDGTALLQEKLRKIKENKAEMERILGDINSVHAQQAAILNGASGSGRELQAASEGPVESPAQNLLMKMMNGAPAGENDDDESAEELVITEEDLEEAIDGVKSQLSDLATVKQRLYDLQRMTQAFNDPASVEPGQNGYDSAPTETEDTDVGESELEENIREVYENGLEEQEQALEELQTERNRLMGIKNQLMKLHQDYPLNENQEDTEAESGPEPEENEEESQRETTNFQQINSAVASLRPLNNSRNSGFQQNDPSHSTTATWGSGRSSADRTMQHQNDLRNPSQSQRPSESPLPREILNSEMPQRSKQPPDSSTIMNNPRLASFRRNNQLETCSNTSTGQLHPDNTQAHSASFNVNLRRASEACVADQYQQLQEHIDSIRTIFQNVSSIHSHPGSRASPSTTHVTQAPLPSQQNFGGLDPVQTVQQQQLLLTQLLTCQQQLQMQQMEMQQLRNFCQELAVSQSARNSDRFVNQSHLDLGNQQQPQFDGRPLSTGSLYNLLAPNPYLPYPYYQPAAQQQQGPTSPPRHPWAPQSAPSLTQTWHPGLQGSKNNQNHGSSYHGGVGGRIDDTEVKSGYGPASKPPPVPRLDITKQSNIYSGAKQRRGSAVQFGQEKNLVRSGARGTPNRIGGSLAASEEHLHHATDTVSTGFVTGEHFEQMREVIYSEVASLISQNEQRPQFLVELFRELQMLRSDSIKARAVQSIRDLLNRYFTETEIEDNAEETREEEEEEEEDFQGRVVQNFSERRRVTDKRKGLPQLYYSTTTVDVSASEAVATSDEDVRRQVGRPPEKGEYAQPIASASSVSTPEKSSASGFGSDPKKATMIKRDTKLNISKRFENLEDIKNVKDSEKLNLKLNNNPLTGQPKPATARTHEIPRIQNGTGRLMEAASAPCSSRVDIAGLETQLETIVDEVIPFLKDNAASQCTPQLLQYLRKLVLTLAITKCVPEDAMSQFFHRQLSTILEDTLAKYNGQKLENCGEELLTDVSEAVFNELAFYRLMQNIDTLGSEAEEENRSRRKSLATESSADVFRDNEGSDNEEDFDSPVIDQNLGASNHFFEKKEGATGKGLSFSVSELKGIGESSADEERNNAPESALEEARMLSASLRDFKANTPRLPPVTLSARDPETNTAVARQLRKDVETVLQAPLVHEREDEEEEEKTESMHTAPQINGMKKSISPEDSLHDSLQDMEEIPEQLEEPESTELQRTPNYPMAFVVNGMHKEKLPRAPIRIDLNVEPHPSDHDSHSPRDAGGNGNEGAN